MASFIDDPISRLETSVERGFISLLGVGCKAPIGVTAIAVGSSVRVVASLVSPDYTYRLYIDRFYDTLKAGDIVERVMKEFEALGGLELVKEWERVSAGQGDLGGD
jgi:Porphobilinogen deaminase